MSRTHQDRNTHQHTNSTLAVSCRGLKVGYISRGQPLLAYFQQPIKTSVDNVYHQLEALVAPSGTLELGTGMVVGYEAYRKAHGIPGQHGPPSSAYPARFIPPHEMDRPESLFIPAARTPPAYTQSLAVRGSTPTRPIQITHTRFVRKCNPDEIIVWTDGACFSKDRPFPSAGCGIKYRPSLDPKRSCFSFRLEAQGPDAVAHTQTSNRAELRAIIAALQFRAWNGEGWKSLVIATDSEYAVLGATEWIRDWEENGWITSLGVPVKNHDLWELLLAEVRKFDKLGLKIQMWRIPRTSNRHADHAAKEGASMKEDIPFRKFCGTMLGLNEMGVVGVPWREILDGRYGGTGYD